MPGEIKDKGLALDGTQGLRCTRQVSGQGHISGSEGLYYDFYGKARQSKTLSRLWGAEAVFGCLVPGLG